MMYFIMVLLLKFTWKVISTLTELASTCLIYMMGDNDANDDETNDNNDDDEGEDKEEKGDDDEYDDGEDTQSIVSN